MNAGGTFTKYALMNENAEILEKDKGSHTGLSYKDKRGLLCSSGQCCGEIQNRIEGIAISMPGMLDNRNGYCVTAGYLGYLAGSTVGTELSQRYGIPVSVENDGKCAALAEFWRGSLKGCTNGLLLLSEPVLQAGSSSTESFSAEIILPQANTAIYAQRRRGRQSWTTTGE